MLRVALLLALPACTEAPSGDKDSGGAVDTGAAAIEARILDLGPLPALPDDPTNAWADDPTARWYGRYLFYDPRLSGTGTFACSTCHDPMQGWGDGQALSEAAGTTGRHAPTLWNAGHQRWMFWDGRCDSLWCQAAGPIEAEHEMAGSRLEVAHAVADNADLREGYEAIFGALPDLSDDTRFPARARPVDGDPDHPDQVAWAAMSESDQETATAVFVNVLKAIGAFERTIQTAESPVDRYVAAYAAGDTAAMDAALSAEAQAGLALFVGEGQCHLCHSGPLMTNLEFHSVGLGSRPWLEEGDLGRYDGITALRAQPFNAAGPWSDDPAGAAATRIDRLVQTSEQLGIFKTPGLRGVATHPPYMHGGHFDSLTQVVEHYNELDEVVTIGHIETFMVPREWDGAQVASLVAFLEALGSEPADPTVFEAPDTPLPP
jgi:cytochrome c peroxidase